jgi:hypothetical protein
MDVNINIKQEIFTFDKIISKVKRKEIVFMSNNYDLDNDTKSNVIESMVYGLPISYLSFNLVSVEDGLKLFNSNCIRTKSIVKSILSFLNNEYRLTNVKIIKKTRRILL